MYYQDPPSSPHHIQSPELIPLPQPIGLEKSEILLPPPCESPIHAGRGSVHENTVHALRTLPSTSINPTYLLLLHYLAVTSLGEAALQPPRLPLFPDKLIQIHSRRPGRPSTLRHPPGIDPAHSHHAALALRPAHFHWSAQILHP